MRVTIRLVVAVVATTTALAATAASAVAVEVAQEDGATLTHCPAVSIVDGAPTGGCPFEMTSEDHVEIRTSLGVDFQCDNHFRARVGENGEGYFYNQVMTPGGEEDDCGRVACNAQPWHVQLSGTAPDYKLELDECVTLFGFIDVSCHLPNIDVDPVGHGAIEFTTATGTVGGTPPADHAPCEGGDLGLQGHWSAVADPGAGLPELEITG